MASGRIKGITIEIDGDTKGLSQALKGVNKDIKSTQTQLKDVEKLLKVDPGNTELLAQKHKLLGEAVKETKEKLKELEKAAEGANEALAKGSISKEQFDIMKDTAYIVNCARGGIIDEDALYDALVNGEILGAGLDVYEEEPAKENKLFELDNIVCTPHIAASTKEAQRDAAIIVANEVITLFKGDMPKNVINMTRMNNAEFEETNNYLELCEKLGWTTETKLLLNIEVSEKMFFNGMLKDFNDIYKPQLIFIDFNS